MSLNAALNNALSGVNTAQRGLALTANNIANAQTPGYTRKVMPQEHRLLAGEGRGVQALETERIVSEFLNEEMRTQVGRVNRNEVLSETYDRLQSSILGAPGDADQGLDAMTRRLTVALQSLSNTPESAADRITAIGAIDDAMADLDDIELKVQAFRGDLDQQIESLVGEVNTKLQGLETINRELTRNQKPADLLDQRDQLIKELGALIEIDVEFEPTGAARIYTGNGEQILDQYASLLTYERAPATSADAVFDPIRIFAPEQYDRQSLTPLAGETGTELVSGGVRRELTPELLGDAIPDADQLIVSPFEEGKLEGLLEARDKILPEVNDQVVELATRLQFELNAAHNGATTVPPPSSLTGTNGDLAGFATATRSGSAYLSIVDNTGTTVTTVAVDLTAASAADLATQLDTDLGALGTATINADGQLAIDLADTTQGLAIATGDGTIDVDVAGVTRSMSFSHYFGLNDLVVEDAASRGLTVRDDIDGDVQNLATAKLDIDPGPPLAGTLGGAGDNRGALELAAVMTEKTTFASRGGLPNADFTIGGYAADVTGLLATRADQADRAHRIDQSIFDDLELRQSTLSGVNIDEELSRLVQYQHSYTTAARVMSIINELFDELLNIPR